MGLAIPTLPEDYSVAISQAPVLALQEFLVELVVEEAVGDCLEAVAPPPHQALDYLEEVLIRLHLVVYSPQIRINHLHLFLAVEEVEVHLFSGDRIKEAPCLEDRVIKIKIKIIPLLEVDKQDLYLEEAIAAQAEMNNRI